MALSASGGYQRRFRRGAGRKDGALIRGVILALVWTALGLGLRLANPPLPVDGAFRDVLRLYGAEVSNTRETSSP